MLWSQLAQDAPIWPPEVRRHHRMATYLDAREGDLTGWRFAKSMELLRLEGKPNPTAAEQERMQGIRKGIEEIDRVLRWRRNSDWPFR